MRKDRPAMLNYLYDFVEKIGNYSYSTLHLEYLEKYIDIQFTSWLLWLFTPIIVAFVFPFILFVFFFLSALFVRAYKYRYRLREAYHRDVWDGARNTLSTLWDALGWLWHGYEMVGIENIPDSGGALLIFYHGAIPIDYYYILAKTILIKKRCIRSVGDHFLFKIPGWNLLMDVCHVFSGSFQLCVQYLKEGHLVALAPGGVLEAQFGDENYQLMWAKRIGFAKVALEAQVPIVPIFTQNLREAFRSVKTGSRFLRKIYERTRFPVLPIYGGFPVKLKTFIGPPIPYDSNLTPEELASKTAAAIEYMINEHQRMPGNILMALVDRVYEKPKLKNI
ncbi:DGAT1/2-independent enzyme synthesizing storage lipids isoform X2 [Parasteatoda tepidariorum]|uniref:DGAT1/2-independent enzyme synthesizing storage lipids isoform X2 n=1 Tax=Parasteatoda tepidariorum TaxID=114398 RepID=UPI00077FB76F|nr:transmembrane protein 68 [Parasteatoda tepidariorum]XP_015906730.1 transmembrane protein 68 [Parasteatoda tepidariorum]XP_015906731.1 transmembrane protein 68 [Parasteatoda tepidariorum]XP_015906732.1 transmembrane protein 68 [Parasteatoda tepidariorum]XP_015906734.1 transmembrane protein 68 [Parasteatoda tepidariorum]XP_015906735.1 transmembrane protein 68 [Parasteatoda tepidariorum]XP_015906736.1 transmembrane protein 68 [Parasteatoda tepidariorum]XP_015906737.1 transmembrane protein 68